MAIVTSDFSPRYLLLSISANPVKVFKNFMKLDRNIELLFVDTPKFLTKVDVSSVALR